MKYTHGKILLNYKKYFGKEGLEELNIEDLEYGLYKHKNLIFNNQYEILGNYDVCCEIYIFPDCNFKRTSFCDYDQELILKRTGKLIYTSELHYCYDYDADGNRYDKPSSVWTEHDILVEDGAWKDYIQNLFNKMQERVEEQEKKESIKQAEADRINAEIEFEKRKAIEQEKQDIKTKMEQLLL